MNKELMNEIQAANAGSPNKYEMKYSRIQK